VTSLDTDTLPADRDETALADARALAQWFNKD